MRLRREGKLQVAAIIEEQHPDRCRLFMQWKRMDWPVLVDALDLLGVAGVPIAILVDEHGIVRSLHATPERLEAFPAARHAPPDPPLPPAGGAPAPVRPEGASAADPAAWIAYGDALFLRARPPDLTSSIEAYRKAVALGAPPEARFRLGVALRRRHDSPARRAGDLQACFDAWQAALDRRPNQYIWRRRIQQYGPRLDKPYAFYDWVAEARREIAARGERPVRLRVEPGGAEIAHPAKTFPSGRGTPREPDPEGRILRDAGPRIAVEVAAAPPWVRPGGSARIHIVLRPAAGRGAHWNNEGEPLRVWIRPPRGVEVDRVALTAPHGTGPTSDEPREVEFEVRVPTRGMPRVGKAIPIPAYALYSVCDGADGVCRYLRQDFRIPLRIR